MLANLFLNFGIDYDKARRMRRSDLRTIFDSKAFRECSKAREAAQKIDVAVIERLDVVIRALGNLGKSLRQQR